MGSVVISVDAELGWGFHDLDEPPMDRVEAARRGWKRLAGLFDQYAVPATWAVVGHLFLEDCDGYHRDHPAPAAWFARERDAWASRPELRFAGELLSDLLDGDVDHEVGCHTFSHVVLTEDWVTPALVRAELAAAEEAAARHGVEQRSFVFPRNAVAHRSVLAERGFTCYRGPVPREGGSVGSNRLGPANKLLGVAFPGRVPLVEPSVDEYGLVNVPPSLFLFSFEGVERTALTAAIGEDPVVRQARHGIDRAVDEDGVFHLWLHPNNLVNARDAERVRAVLEWLRTRVETTDLTVETMGAVSERVRRGRNTPDEA